MEPIAFRRARGSDLPAIVSLLADDPIGRLREDATEPLLAAYRDAFAAIEADPNQLLAVATKGGAVIGTLQISFIPGLSRKGMWRGQIEGVRIAAGHRGEGLGRRAFAWAIGECRARGCGLVQLTTDRERPEAHRFYDQLGFTASHLGYKKTL
ncbi:MAG: GNAT family N-acetyltransferase [Brevundimonas sp.]|nr:GNAT family N-acetyltransferase [Brevundimonas sp.]